MNAQVGLTEAAQMWCRVADAVREGLPVPLSVSVFEHKNVDIRLPDNDAAGVDAWAEHIGLPEPTSGDVIGDPGRLFRSYHTEVRRHAWDETGAWKTEVWSAIHAPDTDGGEPS